MKHCPHCKKALAAPRSLPDHRRFFGLIRAAFFHWPEDHPDFVPDTEEHLRAWLLCKAGYRQVTTIPIEDIDDPAVVQTIAVAASAAIKAAGGYAFVRPDSGAIRVFSAKSMNFETLDQKRFNAVRNAVEDVLKAELGIDPDTLLDETEQAA
jgi:hypothetical protein